MKINDRASETQRKRNGQGETELETLVIQIQSIFFAPFVSLWLKLGPNSTHQMDIGGFGVTTGHFVVYDWVPVRLTLVLGHVILTGPAAELEFADEINFV